VVSCTVVVGPVVGNGAVEVVVVKISHKVSGEFIQTHISFSQKHQETKVPSGHSYFLISPSSHTLDVVGAGNVVVE